MSDHTRKEMEDAIISGLRPLTVEGGGYLRVLARYRGELSVSGIVPEALRMPAVFVAYAGSTFGPGPYLGMCETASYNLIALCREGAEPDAYKVLRDVRDRLAGSSLGLDIRPLRLLREYPLGASKQYTALAAMYSLSQGCSLPAQGE